MSTALIFKKKKNAYLSALIISIVLFLISFSLWYDNELGLTYLILGSVVIALFINIYGFYHWRCPNCKTFLGSSVHYDNCPNCNCSFTDQNKYFTEHTYLDEERYRENYVDLRNKIEIPESLHEFEKMNIYN